MFVSLVAPHVLIRSPLIPLNSRKCKLLLLNLFDGQLFFHPRNRLFKPFTNLNGKNTLVEGSSLTAHNFELLPQQHYIHWNNVGLISFSKHLAVKVITLVINFLQHYFVLFIRNSNHLHQDLLST